MPKALLVHWNKVVCNPKRTKKWHRLSLTKILIRHQYQWMTFRALIQKFGNKKLSWLPKNSSNSAQFLSWHWWSCLLLIGIILGWVIYIWVHVKRLLFSTLKTSIVVRLFLIIIENIPNLVALELDIDHFSKLNDDGFRWDHFPIGRYQT